jgi:hypothetical protein
VTFFARFHIASVVVLMGDTSCQRGIARSLEAQDAKFSDDFMEQFHDDFLTQVQFDNAFYVTYITKIESTLHHLTNQ